jgi:putative membrane protein
MDIVSQQRILTHMRRFLVRWIVSAALLVIVALFVPGIHVSWMAALGAAIVLGLLTAVIRPVLVVLTLPVTLVTFGLFIFVINAVLFWLAALIVPGFTIDGFLPALEGAFLYAVFGALVHILSTIGEKNKKTSAVPA